MANEADIKGRRKMKDKFDALNQLTRCAIHRCDYCEHYERFTHSECIDMISENAQIITQALNGENTTICGYPVQALAEIAYTMQDKGISVSEAVYAMENTNEVVKMIRDAEEKLFHEAFRSFSKKIDPETETELNEGWKKILEAVEGK